MDTAKPSNRKLTFWLLLGVLGMFGFGFALIPLYDIMCEQLGINGKPNNEAVSSPVGMQVDTSRVIRVEFMAHVKPDMPWTFIPAKRSWMFTLGRWFKHGIWRQTSMVHH